MDASVRVVASAAQRLRHGAELLLHTGSVEVTGRTIVLDADEIAAGETGWVQLYLERKTRDLKPLLGRRPVRQDTHQRGPGLLRTIRRPPPEHFEEHRARRTRLDAFCSLLKYFSKHRRAARNSELGMRIFQRERRRPALPFCDLPANSLAQ